MNDLLLVTFFDNNQQMVSIDLLKSQCPGLCTIQDIAAALKEGSIQLTFEGRKIKQIRVLPKKLDFNKLRTKQRNKFDIPQKKTSSIVNCISFLFFSFFSAYVVSNIGDNNISD